MDYKADLIRKRYLYRRLILCGDIRVNRDTAKKIIGPDCAYHLYGKVGNLPREREVKPRRHPGEGKKFKT